MSRYQVALHIIPRRGLLDPQGKAVADALHTLGFRGVRDVHVGRHIVVEMEAADEDTAAQQAREMCEKLLANPVTEDFEIAGIDGAMVGGGRGP